MSTPSVCSTELCVAVLVFLANALSGLILLICMQYPADVQPLLMINIKVKNIRFLLYYWTRALVFLISRVWVRVPVLALVSLSKVLTLMSLVLDPSDGM